MKYELFWAFMAIVVFAWAYHTNQVNAELTSLQTTCYPLLEENKNAR